MCKVVDHIAFGRVKNETFWAVKVQVFIILSISRKRRELQLREPGAPAEHVRNGVDWVDDGELKHCSFCMGSDSLDAVWEGDASELLFIHVVDDPFFPISF